MNTRNLILPAAFIFLLTGCFAPVNLCFENARLLDKKEVKLQAGYGSYFGRIWDDDSDDFSKSVHLNDNLGLSASYGFSDRFNMGLSYQRIMVKSNDFDFLGIKGDTGFGNYNYVEITNKFSLKKDVLAAGVPVGFYFIKDAFLFMFDPRFYYTYRKNDKFELNTAAKLHILIAEGGIGPLPGVTFGMGFSNDLDKWAIRPEIGWDGCWSVGIGFTAQVKGRK